MASSARLFRLPERWRLFVAAPLPGEAAARVAGALRPLRERYPDVRWIPEANLHLTLVFLGATDADRVDWLAAAMEAATTGARSFEVATAAAGGRPTQKRGGVGWLRLGDGAREVAALSLALDSELAGGTYDDRHPPRPHLTVARRVDQAALAGLREWTRSEPAVSWPVDRVVLFRSHTGSTGSRYEELSSTRLTRRA